VTRNAGSRLRICVFSERLAPPFDEGIKNLATAVICELSRRHTVLSLTAFGEDVPEYGIRNVRAGKSLIDRDLAKSIRGFDPHIICYIPTASHTLASFLRARVLGCYARGSRVHMVALQPRRLGRVERMLIRRLCPHRVWVQSDRSAELLRSIGCRVGMLPGGVDTERFRPVPASTKAGLRARHGLSEDEFIVLHAGHINANRNVEVLSNVQHLAGCRAVLLGSTSTPQDAGLVERLRGSGVLVITEYLERVEEWYQLADCYLFPVLSATGSIEVPLSVLEAMACNLPVVTTRYGGLVGQFSGAVGLLYGDDGDALIDQVTAAMTVDDAGTRALVEPFTWETILSNTILAEDR